MAKQNAYSELLEYNSIQKLLEMSIGQKKTKLDSNITFEQQIRGISLGGYLRGIKVFFEYSKQFNNPFEIISFWKTNRDNDEVIEKFRKVIENFPKWIKANKNLGDGTCVQYQAHIRSFLKYNGIMLKFKNYDPKTDKKKIYRKQSITYEILKRFAEKVKEYIQDSDLRLLVEFQHRTGLGYREIADMTLGTLRAKDYSYFYEKGAYPMISDDREKSSVEYMNFISESFYNGWLKDYLEVHKEKPDSDKIFSHIHENVQRAYHLLDQRFNTAYLKCCENHFPKFLDIKTKKGNMKKVFSLHTFRHLVKTTCDNLRIPEIHRDSFLAHKNPNMDNYDLVSEELLEDFKLVEKKLFSVKGDASKEEIQKELMKNLLELINNNGKRNAIHRKYEEDTSVDLDSEITMVLFLENFKTKIIEEVEEKLMNSVMEKVKERIASIPLKDLLNGL